MTAAELEQSAENLRGIVAGLLARSGRVTERLALAEARLSHHQHDFTRDIRGTPATYTPDTHTHSYASTTHVHDYEDWTTGDNVIDQRQTGVPS